MKNHKGEIATFLTLSLVVVGTVLTIATSILTNTKKNIASNPRAAGAGIGALTPKPGTEGGECILSYHSHDNYYYYCSTGLVCNEQSQSGTCVRPSSTLLIPTGCGTGYSCLTDIGTCSSAYGFYGGRCYNILEQKEGICCKPGYTSILTITSTPTRTLTPKPGTEGGRCIFNHNNNNNNYYYCSTGLVCSNQSEDGICVKLSPIPTITPTPTRTPMPTITPQEAYDCSEHGGGTAHEGIGCYDVCSKSGLIYIPNSQGKGSDNKNYCCCKQTEASQGFDTCYKAYRKGMYGCRPNENKVVIYAYSMKAVGMTNCSNHNKESTTALYFAQSPNAYKDGGCYDVWDNNMELNKKNQQAKQLLSPTPEQSLISSSGVTGAPTPEPSSTSPSGVIEALKKTEILKQLTIEENVEVVVEVRNCISDVNNITCTLYITR